ncbi:MAG: hypothetical protein M1840_007391 [Geoglossum simile]|nr:MAG: hypothetical protein M1840_007391 [Geoglossum simile]
MSAFMPIQVLVSTDKTPMRRQELHEDEAVFRVPDACVETLRTVQVAARRVLDLRRPRHVHVEGRKARLDSAVARLARRQSRYDRELMVEQRAALALEESKNSAAVTAPPLVELIAEVRYTNALLRHITGEPPASPAREGLVLMATTESRETSKVPMAP